MFVSLLVVYAVPVRSVCVCMLACPCVSRSRSGVCVLVCILIVNERTAATAAAPN